MSFQLTLSQQNKETYSNIKKQVFTFIQQKKTMIDQITPIMTRQIWNDVQNKNIEYSNVHFKLQSYFDCARQKCLQLKYRQVIYQVIVEYLNRLEKQQESILVKQKSMEIHLKYQNHPFQEKAFNIGHLINSLRNGWLNVKVNSQQSHSKTIRRLFQELIKCLRVTFQSIKINQCDQQDIEMLNNFDFLFNHNHEYNENCKLNPIFVGGLRRTSCYFYIKVMKMLVSDRQNVPIQQKENKLFKKLVQKHISNIGQQQKDAKQISLKCYRWKEKIQKKIKNNQINQYTFKKMQQEMHNDIFQKIIKNFINKIDKKQYSSFQSQQSYMIYKFLRDFDNQCKKNSQHDFNDLKLPMILNIKKYKNFDRSLQNYTLEAIQKQFSQTQDYQQLQQEQKITDQYIIKIYKAKRAPRVNILYARNRILVLYSDLGNQDEINRCIDNFQISQLRNQFQKNYVTKSFMKAKLDQCQFQKLKNLKFFNKYQCGWGTNEIYKKQTHQQNARKVLIMCHSIPSREICKDKRNISYIYSYNKSNEKSKRMRVNIYEDGEMQFLLVRHNQQAKKHFNQIKKQIQQYCFQYNNQQNPINEYQQYLDLKIIGKACQLKKDDSQNKCIQDIIKQLKQGNGKAKMKQIQILPPCLKKIKILTWNIQSTMSKYQNTRIIQNPTEQDKKKLEGIMIDKLTSIVNQILSHNADFVCLQQTQHLLDRKYQQIFQRLKERYYYQQNWGSLILSKFPVYLYQIRLQLGGYANAACQFQIQIQGQRKSVLMVSIHLVACDSKIPQRGKQMEFFNQISQKFDICIFAGDFNFGQIDQKFKKLNQLSKQYIDLDQCHNGPRKQGTYFKGNFANQRFDKILLRVKDNNLKDRVSKNIKFKLVGDYPSSYFQNDNHDTNLQYGVFKMNSDHKGVYAEISFKSNII